MTESATLYERWVTSDPLLPGVSHTLVYSLGALLALLNPDLAMLGLGIYVIFAFGARVGYVKNQQ